MYMPNNISSNLLSSASGNKQLLNNSANFKQSNNLHFAHSQNLDAKTQHTNNLLHNKKQAVQQFEALLWQQALTVLHKSNQYLTDNNSHFEAYQQMYDENLSKLLAQHNPLGLSKALKLDNTNLDSEQNNEQNLPKINELPKNYLKTTNLPKYAANHYYFSLDTNKADHKHNFIANVINHANKAAKQLGVDPTYLIAQAALETNWGRQISGNNLFGIKNHGWGGKSSINKTFEMRAGKWQVEQASFRNYHNFAQSFNDYVTFLQSNTRYQKALQVASTKASNSSEQFINELQKAGYATDPNYARKIRQIRRQVKTTLFANSNNLNNQANANNKNDLASSNNLSSNNNLVAFTKEVKVNKNNSLNHITNLIKTANLINNAGLTNKNHLTNQ